MDHFQQNVGVMVKLLCSLLKVPQSLSSRSPAPPTLGPQNIWTRRYMKTKYYQKTCGNLSNKWKFGVQIWNSDEKMWGPW